jgi:putative glycosyltransferase (TIGR04348 family)
VEIGEDDAARRCDLLVALHARRSHPAVLRYRASHPGGPLVVALTGTDVYGDIRRDDAARESLALADRLVALQPLSLDELPPGLRGKARVIYQSAPALAARPAPRHATFDVSVVGHLRPVKDPFLPAAASRLLPPPSRIRVLQVGAALEEEMRALALREARENPRYRWLGELPRWRARREMARSRLLVLPSRMEGGANVISEAAVMGVSVLVSAIPGSLGLLGADYPGAFPVGDAPALAALLLRAEREPAFLADLEARVRAVAPLFTPAREQAAWQSLLAELFPARS